MQWINRVKVFWREVVAEMKKVTFPSRDEVIGTTIVVIVTSVIFAVFLFLADQVILQLYSRLNQALGV